MCNTSWDQLLLFRIKTLFKIFFKRFHFFIHERQWQRHKQREKEAPCREPDVGLDPKTKDHTLSQEQVLNHWATQASPIRPFLYMISGAHLWVFLSGKDKGGMAGLWAVWMFYSTNGLNSFPAAAATQKSSHCFMSLPNALYCQTS